MAGKKAAKSGFNKSAEAQSTAARLPEMVLDAQKLAGLVHGLRKRTKSGQGTEFHKFRPYENGTDNPHKIDWKSSARRIDHDGNDALLMREREMEVTQSIYIWCDGSKSMDYKAPRNLFPDQPPRKKRRKS